MRFAELVRFDFTRSVRAPAFRAVAAIYLLASLLALMITWPGRLRVIDLAIPEASPEAFWRWLSLRIPFAWLPPLQLFILGFAAVVLASAPNREEEHETGFDLQAFAVSVPVPARSWLAVHLVATGVQLVVLAGLGMPFNLVAMGPRLLATSTAVGQAASPLFDPAVVASVLAAGLAALAFLAVAALAGTLAGVYLEIPWRWGIALLFAGSSGFFLTGLARPESPLNPFSAVWVTVTYTLASAARPLLSPALGTFWPTALFWLTVALLGGMWVSKQIEHLRESLWLEGPDSREEMQG